MKCIMFLVCISLIGCASTYKPGNSTMGRRVKQAYYDSCLKEANAFYPGANRKDLLGLAQFRCHLESEQYVQKLD